MGTIFTKKEKTDAIPEAIEVFEVAPVVAEYHSDSDTEVHHFNLS